MNNIRTTTLGNGMRIVTDAVPSMDSVALGIWASVGTRHEVFPENGIAHMVEHMLFKGTHTRNALQIVEDVETRGGDINAYTSREMTSYHIHILKEHSEFALDILADMVLNSTLPEEEIERERQVILQEIGMCHDTPDDLVFDQYFETAYPQQSLGAPILGRAETIAAMQRGPLAAYIDNLYQPQNLILSAAGDVDHDKLVAQAKALFGDKPQGNKATLISPDYKAAYHYDNKKLEQVHFLLGFEGVARASEAYIPARVLSSVLGGGMSSRLFQEVREKRGLAYSVYSFHSSYHDTGQLAIYVGTSPKDVAELVDVLCAEVNKVVQGGISDAELERAKVQLKSGFLMGRESMMARADQQARSLIYKDRPLDPEALAQEIESLSKEDVSRVASKIFCAAPCVAALGPLNQAPDYDAIAAKLAA